MYQPDILNESEQQELLKIARSALECSVRNEHCSPPPRADTKLHEIHGVLCTLYKDGHVRARSVIGLPYPLLPLVEATVSAATAAAHENEEPLQASELSEVKIELTVVTIPKLLDVMRPADKYLTNFTQSDGLILKYGVYEAFLPPQSWQGMTKEEFLDVLCLHAGLTKGMWKEEGVELSKFSAQYFSE